MDEKIFAKKVFSLVGKIRDRFDVDDRINIKEISSTSFTILGAIYHSDGITIKEIAEYMNIKHSNCSRSVAGLLEGEYLKKVTAKEDERKVKLYLTEKGIDVVKTQRKKMVERVSEKARDYSGKKIEDLYKKLKEVDDILDSL